MGRGRGVPEAWATVLGHKLISLATEAGQDQRANQTWNVPAKYELDWSHWLIGTSVRADAVAFRVEKDCAGVTVLAVSSHGTLARDKESTVTQKVYRPGSGCAKYTVLLCEEPLPSGQSVQLPLSACWLRLQSRLPEGVAT
jgi:hypothetical protein